MKTLYERYKSYDFTYIAVNVDNQKSVSKVKSYVYTNKFTFPVILDTDEKIFESYSGTAIPYYLFINKDKEVTNSTIGYNIGDEKMIEDEIRLMLRNVKEK